MKLIAYLRVSTDDKNQDPERQRPVLEACAKRDGHEIVAWVIEKEPAGEGATYQTLDRPKVRVALDLAQEHKAGGIMVENVDRWTRRGSMDLGYSMFVLERDHKLKILFADLPADDFARDVLPPLMATLAKMDNKRRSDQARTSAARKKMQGVRLGRPPKPDLTDDELQAVAVLVRAGRGMRLAALEVSRLRGAFEVSDPAARRRRVVSASWLTDQLARRTESPGLLGRVVQPTHRRPRPNGPFLMQGETA